MLAQTHGDLELVVVDDGSSDATAAIAAQRALLDARVRVISQANAGSHAAINRGIAESSAPWVAILNSDDRYAATRLERLLARCSEAHDFAVTGVRLIDAQGAPIADPGHWLVRTLADFQAKADSLGPVEGLLYGNYTVSTSNFFFSLSSVSATTSLMSSFKPSVSITLTRAPIMGVLGFSRPMLWRAMDVASTV